jgi:hypothetical protein
MPKPYRKKVSYEPFFKGLLYDTQGKVDIAQGLLAFLALVGLGIIVWNPSGKAVVAALIMEGSVVTGIVSLSIAKIHGVRDGGDVGRDKAA